LRIAFIGDVVGKPGRMMLQKYLPLLREEHAIDFVIANYENASHGFGLTEKNCLELLECGVDMMTGGNHSFDKKEVLTLFDKYPLIRPANYPKSTPGTGVYEVEVNGVQLAVVNILGHYTMPMVDNPFTVADDIVESLVQKNIKHIVIDMHAEATSEKQALLHILGDKVSAIVGTHTHVSTDDLQIVKGCCYITDLGLTGCRDGVIGMDPASPIKRFMTGIGSHFDVPDHCKSISHILLVDLDKEGKSLEAKKLKIYDDGSIVVTHAKKEID